jgi:hypothetical protein
MQLLLLKNIHLQQSLFPLSSPFLVLPLFSFFIHPPLLILWFFGDIEKYQGRDHIKRSMMKEVGCDLVIVPCWWDFATERFS